MSILFSGDFHANERNEISVITKKSLVEKYGREKYSSIKYHVILGDGGFMWQNNEKSDKKNYDALARRPFPVLCVVGNHEPILGMRNVPEADIGIGETVYQIHDNPFVAYLKRGKVYTIEGIKFLVLGGALSIDKLYRTPNRTWWELEYWTDQEKQNVFNLLESENTFDCVISHTGPNHINRILFKSFFRAVSDKFYDEVAFLNDEICSRIKFSEWFCGHWHQDKYYFDEETKHSYRYLYKTTEIVEKLDNQLTIYSEYC